MKKDRVLKVGLLIVFMTALSHSLFAQSSYTRHGQNGVLFDLNTALSSENAVSQAGGRIGLSIGGVLDIGADFLLSNDKVQSEDSQETNIGVRYGVMVLKQENQSPVSLLLGGTYGYSFVASDYYTDNSLQKEGQGYSLSIELLRDFSLGGNLLFRLGGFGEFRSYNYSIMYVTQETEDNQQYTASRETAYTYGGVASVGIKTAQGRTYYVEGRPSVNDDGDLSLEIRGGMVFNLR